MNDKVSKVIAARAELAGNFSSVDNDEMLALAHGFDALFELAASHEKQIAELETRLNGLLGLGGGLDTALAASDAHISVLRDRVQVLEAAIAANPAFEVKTLAETTATDVRVLEDATEDFGTRITALEVRAQSHDDTLFELSGAVYTNTHGGYPHAALEMAHTPERPEADAKAVETVTLERKFAEELAEMLRDVKPDLEHYESNFTYDEFVEFVNRFQQVVWPNGMPF